ncbi:Inner membrane protein YbaL [Aquisphaera giovannonii]|uniref:Inner membrane protein YbaL n=1 Tax=Aquisphaera giovannonii TaxID=406548 RepID=A0A5B9VZD6_9BACT|nr:cation:proton antiporter [Aquisphaera giovannonii]QEH33776.1 Inner membrane protein YbaL [Aquisphaera giovannonii]
MAHEEDSLISTVAVGLSYAFGGGLLAAKIGLPPLVGYLVAGIAVGPFTPGFVADTALAPQLAEIGVILLMFGVGMHFSIGDLLAVRRIAVPGAAAQITVATAMGAGMAASWGWPLMAGLIFGLALSVASTVVLLRALEDRRLLHSRDGRVAVGWLVVEDLAMVLALVLLPALAGGPPEGGGPDAWELFQAVALTLAKVAAFVAVMLVVGVRIFPWILARVEGLRSRELFTLAVIALSLGVAFVAARVFGVSFALGAFFAGVVINESELSRRAARDLQPLQDAFAALFFVSVGMLFDPSVLTQHPLSLLAVVAIITVGKSLAAMGIVLALGEPLSTAMTVSASLAQIGEFSFILASLGLSLKIVPPEGQSLIVAGALVSIVLNPLAFAAVRPWMQAQPQDPEPPPAAQGH